MRSDVSSLPQQLLGRGTHRRKIVGLAVLAVPLFVMGLFAIAEGMGGEEGWWGHLIQFGVLGLLAAGAWFRPKLVGPVLVVLGLAFAGSVLSGAQGEGAANVPGIVIVAAPMVVAGVMFTLASGTGQAEGR